MADAQRRANEFDQLQSDIDTDASTAASGGVEVSEGSRHGARFRQIFTLEDAIGYHACSLEANTRVTNGIHLGSSPLLPVDTVICVATPKESVLQTFQEGGGGSRCDIRGVGCSRPLGVQVRYPCLSRNQHPSSNHMLLWCKYGMTTLLCLCFSVYIRLCIEQERVIVRAHFRCFSVFVSQCLYYSLCG
jgi:hypothetical protein